jgi:serine/threonine protein kinase
VPLISPNGDLLNSSMTTESWPPTLPISPNSWPLALDSLDSTMTTEFWHLGTGYYGDVWLATDKHTNEMVAIKILYSRDQQQYLSWKSVETLCSKDQEGQQCKKTKQIIEESINECRLTKELNKQRKMFPVGSKRICMCLEDHINEARGTDKVLFLTMEYCGTDLRGAMREYVATHGSIDVRPLNSIAVQILEAIEFFRAIDPPFIHADLKPDNIVVRGFPNDPQIKLIDFGKSKFVEPGCAKPSGDIRYGPPMSSPSDPTYAFDMFSAGLIFLELLLACPRMPEAPWYDELWNEAMTMSQWRERFHTNLKGLADKYFFKYCSNFHRSKYEGMVKADLAFINLTLQQVPAARPEPLNALRLPIFRSIFAEHQKEAREEVLQLWDREACSKSFDVALGKDGLKPHSINGLASKNKPKVDSDLGIPFCGCKFHKKRSAGDLLKRVRFDSGKCEALGKTCYRALLSLEHQAQLDIEGLKVCCCPTGEV